MEKRFFSGMCIRCMFSLIFTTTFALMLPVSLPFDFSVKVINGDVISFDLLIPNVKIVSLSNSAGSNFNLLRISSVTEVLLLLVSVRTLVTSDKDLSGDITSTIAICITVCLSTESMIVFFLMHKLFTCRILQWNLIAHHGIFWWFSGDFMPEILQANWLVLFAISPW